MFRKFHTITVTDRVLNQIQDNVSRALDPISAVQIINGALLEEVQLFTGPNIVNHKLGRELIGWVVTRKRAAAELYDTQDSNPQPQRTLLLTSDADVTVDIWVF